jgi:hypothetical protein
VLTSPMDASLNGVQHLHCGTSRPLGGVHIIKAAAHASLHGNGLMLG